MFPFFFNPHPRTCLERGRETDREGGKEREREGEEWREKHQSFLDAVQLGDKCETQACALPRNGNVNLLVPRKTPNQLSHTGWAT